ncbi:MAG: aldehyde dehydrogenase family protein [Chloroflexota bacterium]
MTGAALAAHPGVGKVAFTGETATGQAILHAAGTIKKVSLELGGKSPNVVRGRGHRALARESPYGVFDNAGQDCRARSRDPGPALGPRRVVELFGEATSKVVWATRPTRRDGDGTLVTRRHMESVLARIEAGRAEGAHVVTGGGRLTGAAFDEGTYVAPTVFDRATPGMSIVREEVFGPVVAVILFGRRGRCGPPRQRLALWAVGVGVGRAGHRSRPARLAGIRSGVISVNCNSSVHTQAPFGGMKQSGLGRELGMHALDEYTELKNVYVDLT